MSLRLPLVLSADDLPPAELFAARLDGELFRIADCFAPVDEIEQPTHRASALKAGLPARLIAEQHSAAWVWGAIAAPPAAHELCAAMDARTRAIGARGFRVREVVIEPGEIATVAGLQVTNPLRTAIDLARFSVRFGEVERAAARSLMASAGFTLDDCLRAMQGRRNLPNKRRAAERLARANRC